MSKKILVGMIVAVVIIGVLICVFLLREIAQKNIIFLSVSIFLLIIFLAILISFYFYKRITIPLKELRKGVEIVGKGNLDYRIELKTRDEIEELAKAFNQMTEDLRESHTALEEAKTVLEIKVRARTKELEEFSKRLEEQVTERTKELQERIKELEKFHRLTVGRELKMIELKEEIKRLKKAGKRGSPKTKK